MTTGQLDEPLRLAAQDLRQACWQSGSAGSVQLISKVNLLVELLDDSARLQRSGSTDAGLSLAIADASNLAAQLRMDSPHDSIVRSALLDRASESITRFHLGMCRSPRPEGGDTNSSGRVEDTLARLVGAYSKDASDARRAAVSSLVGAVVSLVIAASLVVAATVLSTHGSGGNGNHLDAGPFFARAIACLPFFVLASALLWLAARQRRGAHEALRLARQLTGLPAYLYPLPPSASHLMRMTMTQRLFPRLIEDTDPLRDAPWPDTSELLRAAESKSG